MTRYKWPLIFFLVFSLSFIPAHFLNPEISSYDDTSYLAHAYTLGLDLDLDYQNEVVTKFNKNRTLPSHPIGSGVLAAPFVALFGILDRITSHDVISNRASYFGSWSYFGFLFSVSTYFLMGLTLYFQALKLVESRYPFGLHLLLVLSTGMTYYVLGRFTMSHGFEFFGFAGTVYASVGLYKNIYKADIYRSVQFLLLVGLFVVLNLWIRPVNINCLLLPFICLLTLNVANATTLEVKWYGWIMASIGIFLTPYFMFNSYYYDQILPTYVVAYSASSFGAGLPLGVFETIIYILSLIPNLVLVIFSSEFGVLYSNPIIIIGFVGLLITLILGVRNKARIQSLLLLCVVVIYVGFSVAIVLVWKTTASDYGYRYLFPIIPVAMLFTTMLLREIREKRSSWLMAVKCLIVGISIVGIGNVFFYKTTPELSPKDQVNIFGQEHGASVKGYETNLLRALVEYRTYVLSIGKSYYGLLGAPWVTDSEFIDFLSDKQKEKYIPRFLNVAPMIYFQTFILLGLWIGFGWYIGRQIAQVSRSPWEGMYSKEVRE